MTEIIRCKKCREDLIDGTWELDESSNDNWSKDITEETYRLIVGKDVLHLFKVLNFKDRIYKDAYGRVRQLVSVFPDRCTRVVYNFEFIDKEEIN